MKTYYVDGKFVPQNKAHIPVDDLAVLRGLGVCDIMRTFGGTPFFMEDHVQRLLDSAAKIGLNLPWNTNQLINIILETLKKNQPVNDVNIRTVITGGSSSDYFLPDGSPRLIIMVTDIKPLPAHWYTKGVKVITVHRERTVPEAKTIAYADAAEIMIQAKKMGAVEAIYINRLNQALEGTGSNLFAFISDTLVTPEDGILKGITRKIVLETAEKLFRVKCCPMDLKMLKNADEVFISGTNKGVVPVVQVDDTVIGTGLPGKRTLVLIENLKKTSEKFIQEGSA